MRALRTFPLIVPLLFAFTVLAQKQSSDDERLSLAKNVMDEMASGQIASVFDRFTPDLKDSLTEDKMQFVWNRLLGASGAFQKQISQSTRIIRGTTVYVAKSQFEDSKVELRLTFNDSNQISRIWIAPVSDLSAETMEAAAKQLVELLHQKHFDEVGYRFSDELKASMPPERLDVSWSHVLSHLGQFKNIQLAAKDPELDLVDVACVFETGEIIVRVAFDPSGKVGGLWMLPAESQPTDSPRI